MFINTLTNDEFASDDFKDINIIYVDQFVIIKIRTWCAHIGMWDLINDIHISWNENTWISHILAHIILLCRRDYVMVI